MSARHRPAMRHALPLVAVGAAAAIALSIVVVSTNDSTGRSGNAPVVTLVGVTPGSAISIDGTPAAAGQSPAAPTAEAAVRRYLDGEIGGRPELSYGQLSADELEVVGTVDDWQAGADERPAYASYEIVGTSADRVVVEARRVPMVSEIEGIAPAQERIEFVIRAEDGGYRVVLDETKATPTYPSPGPAAAVATGWITAQQSCASETSPLEYDGNLLGTLGLAESLCGASGSPAVTETGSLDALDDPSIVLSAFGEDATEWAHVVKVTGLTDRPPVQVILAPYGEKWLVVGGVAVGGVAVGGVAVGAATGP